MQSYSTGIGIDDGCLEQVDIAYEVGDKPVGGVFVNLTRCSNLFEASLVHYGDTCRQRHRFFLIVSHDDKRDTEIILQVHEFKLGMFAQLLVEGGQRLIEKQKFGTLDERARQGNALTFAARQPARFSFCERS